MSSVTDDPWRTEFLLFTSNTLVITDDLAIILIRWIGKPVFSLNINKQIQNEMQSWNDYWSVTIAKLWLNWIYDQVKFWICEIWIFDEITMTLTEVFVCGMFAITMTFTPYQIRTGRSARTDLPGSGTGKSNIIHIKGCPEINSKKYHFTLIILRLN